MAAPALGCWGARLKLRLLLCQMPMGDPCATPVGPINDPRSLAIGQSASRDEAQASQH